MSETTSDKARFDDLYRRYRVYVHAYCLRRTGPIDAQDAVSETFVVAWRRIAQIPTGEMALPWLYGVAYRTIANQRRSAQRSLKLTERLARLVSEDAPPVDEQVVRHWQAQQVLDLMTRLQPQDREVLRLVAWEELPREAIAVVLSCSKETVNQRYHRALKRMSKELINAGFQPNPQPAPLEGGSA
jgi:RNA polymerase sigma-70 factor (ECF subfamily)